MSGNVGDNWSAKYPIGQNFLNKNLSKKSQP